MKRILALLLLLFLIPLSALATDYPCTGVALKSAVNIRKSADKKSNSVDKLNKDQEIVVLGETLDSAGTLWYEIRLSGKKTGFVSSEYIELVDPQLEKNFLEAANAAKAALTQAADAQQKIDIPVYVAAKGERYHASPNCSNMKDPREVSYSEARELGYTACAKCYRSSASQSTSTKSGTDSAQTKKIGTSVYVTSSGKKYHFSSKCSNMKSPQEISYSEAIERGYTACSKCCSSASQSTSVSQTTSTKSSTSSKQSTQTSQTQKSGKSVYVTSSGKKYHSSSSCSNMKNPKKISLEEAKAKGYTACSKCY